MSKILSIISHRIAWDKVVAQKEYHMSLKNKGTNFPFRISMQYREYLLITYLSGKKGITTFNSLTRWIELFFLNRTICYKWYLWQIIMQYWSKQNINFNCILFVDFQRKIIITRRLKKIKTFNLRRDMI